MIRAAKRCSLAILALAAASVAAVASEQTETTPLPTKPGDKATGYAQIDGLRMYYEVIGVGRPTVYIHPVLSQCGLVHGLPADRQWITMDLQGHGRTADIDRPITCERHADDIAALLAQLKIEQADVFGDSFGGTIAVTLAVRHPTLVRRVVSYGSPLAPLPKDLATVLTPDGDLVRWEREEYRKVAPDPAHWPVLFAKVLQAGIAWKGFTPDELKAIRTPILLACGDHDLTPVERCAELSRLVPNAQLAVIPDASHFILFSEPKRLLATVTAFFDAPADEVPLATFATGYYPGVTR